MHLGLIFALVAAICYGLASTIQAVAARSTRDTRHGLDPRLVLRLLGQWRYLLSLALDLAGLLAQVAALRSLPLFLVQACMAASIVVTALAAAGWFGVRLSGREWASVAAVCAGLAMLGSAACSEGAGHASGAFHVAILAATVLLALLGLGAGRLPNGPRTVALGLVAGLGYGALGTAIRLLPALDPRTVLTDPATYAALVAGGLATWFYAAALQRGGVVTATAMMLIGETVPPSLVGVALLGDHTRPGWTPVALAGFVVAVAGALVLARFGEPSRPEPHPEADPVRAR